MLKWLHQEKKRADFLFLILWLIDENPTGMEMSALKIWRQLKYLLCNKCLNDMPMQRKSETDLKEWDDVQEKKRQQINVKLQLR